MYDTLFLVDLFGAFEFLRVFIELTILRPLPISLYFHLPVLTANTEPLMRDT